MPREVKIAKIRKMIDNSKRFRAHYGKKLIIIKQVLIFMPTNLLDKIYGFLLLETNEKQNDTV